MVEWWFGEGRHWALPYLLVGMVFYARVDVFVRKPLRERVWPDVMARENTVVSWAALRWGLLAFVGWPLVGLIAVVGDGFPLWGRRDVVAELRRREQTGA